MHISYRSAHSLQVCSTLTATPSSSGVCLDSSQRLQGLRSPSCSSCPSSALPSSSLHRMGCPVRRPRGISRCHATSQLIKEPARNRCHSHIKLTPCQRCQRCQRQMQGRARCVLCRQTHKLDLCLHRKQEGPLLGMSPCGQQRQGWGAPVAGRQTSPCGRWSVSARGRRSAGRRGR